MPHVALLRGINVGGKNVLPMKDLAAIFVAARCADVRTYIQSGNVVFSAPGAKLDALAKQIAERIEKRFGFRTPVILRTLEELEKTVRNNPFLKPAPDKKTLHVAFLMHSPPAEAVASLDPNRSGTDRFHVRDREIYLHLPNGMARTKLTNAYFDSKLSTISTMRNWATVSKLLAMMQAQ